MLMIVKENMCNNDARYVLKRVTQFSSWQEVFVTLAYFFACIMGSVGSHWESASQIFRYLVAGLLLISIDYTKWDTGKVCLCVFLLLSLVMRRLLVIWTLMVFAYQIDYLKIPIKRLAFIGAVTLGLILLIHVDLVLFELIRNKGVYYQKADRVLYDLGFGNSNRAGLTVLFLCICIYITAKDKYRWLMLFSIIIIGYIFYSITGARTSFYGILILLFTAIMIWLGVIRKWMRWIMALLPLVCFVGTFWLAANYKVGDDVDDVASGRVWYVVKFTSEYGMKEWMIGSPKEMDDPLDSSYLDMITKGGVLLASFFCFGFAKTVIKYYNRTKEYLPFLFTMVGAGLSETIFNDPNSVSVLFWVIIMQAYFKQKPVLT